MTLPIQVHTIDEAEKFFLNNGQSDPTYSVAVTVILEALGEVWLDRFEHYLATRADLKTLPHDVANMEKCILTIRLAHAIYLLQACSGFLDRIEEIKTANVEAATFELQLAAMLVQNSHALSFVKPIGQRGKDYDFDIQVDGCWIAVEAKTRRKGALTNRKTLRNALNTARTQLPVDRPGVIAVFLASQYEGISVDTHSLVEIDREIHAFLMTTTRVNSVIVIWHSWEGQSGVCKTMVRESTKCMICQAIPSRYPMPRAHLISPINDGTMVDGQSKGFPSFSAKNRSWSLP